MAYTLCHLRMKTTSSEFLRGGHRKCRSANEQSHQDDDGDGQADKKQESAPDPIPLRTFNTQRPWTKSASTMQTVSQSGIDPETYSHSIINEPSKLLIYEESATASALFTVKLSGTSTGAGFRAVRPNPTFRDRSSSINSRATREPPFACRRGPWRAHQRLGHQTI